MRSQDGIPVVARRAWWATFSVLARQNRRALASDVQLYDRLILPRPASAEERQHFDDAGWDADDQALREIQAADSIYTVIWSRALRKQWRRQIGAITGRTNALAMGATPT